MRLLTLLLLIVGAIAAVCGTSYAQVAAEVQIRNTDSKADDFLCWAPVKARARLLTAAADTVVTMRSMPTVTGSGDVGFIDASVDVLTKKPSNELKLTLLKDGSWAEFYVVGMRASTNGKDVTIRAETLDGTAVGASDVMVRVRKNAESLTLNERTAFLRALATWKSKPGLARPTRFEDYYTTHNDAFSLGIHSEFGSKVSNFLPWHRAFLLSFERELQEIDPTVSLPYWKFDAPAPKLFSEDFFGTLLSQSTEVQFSPTNPLRGWRLSSNEALRRAKVYATVPAISPNTLERIVCPTNAPSCAKQAAIYRAVTDTFEQNYHNNVHGAVGGWLGAGTSPSDPLFFLLHANVDRGWARWQEAHDHFTDSGADPLSYTPINGYPGPADTGRVRRGLYALDEMWPWGKPAPTGDPMAQWLPYTYIFPASEGLPVGPTAPPSPRQMIDYLGKKDPSNALGTCYDDLRYHGP
jgi:tyrosinase